MTTRFRCELMKLVTMMFRCELIVLSLILLGRLCAADTIVKGSYSYDESFPVLGTVKKNSLGDRPKIYREHLDGCRKVYGASSCDLFEYDRLLMNRRQPVSMKNYTDVGFKVVEAPAKVKDLVSKFWESNKDKKNWKTENWGRGNVYCNHWDSPSYQLSVDDAKLRGSGARLKKEIWAAASTLMELWTQEELQPVSMYGIRIYTKGAIMLPHVDRLPLVASAMIHVAHDDSQESWPTEIYSHDGRVYNVTLKAGEMLLLESHSIVHGHPFPLKGDFHASLFMHFEPTGHSLDHNASGYFLRHHHDDAGDFVDVEYKEHVKQGFGGQSAAHVGGILPPYIQRSSPEEQHWRSQHPEGWSPPYEVLPPDSHLTAKAGNVQDLERLLASGKDDILTERDHNGWQILHQGVTSGNPEVVDLLLKNGADINARTQGGYGETPLRIAENLFGKLHPVVELLKNAGALSIGPEL